MPIAWNSIAVKRKGADWSEDSVVPVCGECNSLLGRMPLFSIAERADYLATKLATRYRRILQAPVWTEEDIAKLDGTLKKHIQAKQSQRNQIMERVRRCVFAARLPSLKMEDIWAAHHKGKTLAEYLADERLMQDRATGEVVNEFTERKSAYEIGLERQKAYELALAEMVKNGDLLSRIEICRSIGVPEHWINSSEKKVKQYVDAFSKAEKVLDRKTSQKNL